VVTRLKSPTLLERAKELQNGIVSYRRRIHANPELSFCEHETAKLIADAMRKFGYSVQEGVGGTGVLASLASPGWTGQYIGIRADMDALPMSEANSDDYSSRNGGVMHACGHDAHVACSLGAAKLLADAILRGDAELGVRFLFQPAEETVNADGKSGASLMIEAGALANISHLIALHVFPGIPCGNIGVRDEFLLAACDSFTIKVKGKGCHGAQPEAGVDSIVIATQLVQALQTIVSRKKPANDVAVMTIGGIRSSTFAPNIVAEEVELTGTVRYFKPEMQRLFQTEIETICGLVETMGGSFKLDYNHETPALWNDPSVTAVVRQVAEKMLGTGSVFELGQQLGADDFSFYTANVPCCYFILGVSREDRATELHNPNFDINEDALPVGAALLAETALALSAVASKPEI